MQGIDKALQLYFLFQSLFICAIPYSKVLKMSMTSGVHGSFVFSSSSVVIYNSVTILEKSLYDQLEFIPLFKLCQNKNLTNFVLAKPRRTHQSRRPHDGI